VRTLALVSSLALLAAATAHAQRNPSASEQELGRDEFNAGMRAVHVQSWDEACRHFERAYELTRRAGILVNLASAELQRGRLVEASVAYREFLRSAEEARGATRERVTSLLDALEGRIPRAELAIEGLADGDRVLLDGNELSRAAVGAALPVNPGRHRIEVERFNAIVARTSFEVAERERPRVSLEVPRPVARGRAHAATDLEVPRAHVATRRSPVTMVDEGEQDDDDGGGVLSSPWFWLATGVLVAGGVVAAVLLWPSEEPVTAWEGTIPPGHWDVR